MATRTTRTLSVQLRLVATEACVTIDHGPETYVFAADEKGQIADWLDLPGSFIGSLDHERAMRGAGYEVES